MISYCGFGNWIFTCDVEGCRCLVNIFYATYIYDALLSLIRSGWMAVDHKNARGRYEHIVGPSIYVCPMCQINPDVKTMLGEIIASNQPEETNQ